MLESIRSTAICLVSKPCSMSIPAKVCICGRPHRKLPVSVTNPAYIACAISALRVTPSSSKTGAKTVVVDSHATSTKLILPKPWLDAWWSMHTTFPRRISLARSRASKPVRSKEPQSTVTYKSYPVGKLVTTSTVSVPGIVKRFSEIGQSWPITQRVSLPNCSNARRRVAIDPKASASGRR